MTIHLSSEETLLKRQAVIAEALSWLGTPFHDRAGVKGAGCDCAHLLKQVFVAVSLIADFAMPPYSPQWFLHRDEEVFLNVIKHYAIPVKHAQPGDIEMYNFGRHAAHGGIVIDDRTLIHAYKPIGRVNLDERQVYVARYHSAWSVFA